MSRKLIQTVRVSLFLFAGILFFSGCGGGKEASTTTGDELSNYLTENPELAELDEQPEIDPADLDE